MRELLRMDGIFDAAAHGDARTLRALVTLGGADANAADALGCAPVWIAARGGHAAAVRALAACGADVRAADENGRTPVFERPRTATRRRCWRCCWNSART